MGEGEFSNPESDQHPTPCVGTSSPSFQSDAAAHPDRLTSDQDEKDSAFPPNHSLFSAVRTFAYIVELFRRRSGSGKRMRCRRYIERGRAPVMDPT